MITHNDLIATLCDTACGWREASDGSHYFIARVDGKRIVAAEYGPGTDAGMTREQIREYREKKLTAWVFGKEA